jgi:hypothetical protein
MHCWGHKDSARIFLIEAPEKTLLSEVLAI